MKKEKEFSQKNTHCDPNAINRVNDFDLMTWN